MLILIVVSLPLFILKGSSGTLVNSRFGDDICLNFSIIRENSVQYILRNKTALCYRVSDVAYPIPNGWPNRTFSCNVSSEHMSICITKVQKEDSGQFSLRIGVNDYRENLTLSVTGRASPKVYIEKGGEGCISFPQAETRTTDKYIMREDRVLCVQFSGSIEIGLILKGAWNRSFSCQSNTSHVSVCITNASKEDEGIFTYKLLSVPIDNRTLIITSPTLTITPKSPATVKEGQSLVLTCQSTVSGGIYQFFTLDNQGNRVMYGVGGGSFKGCSNGTQLAFIECSFGDPWLFNLTLLKPTHNQEVYCSRQVGQEGWNTSTIIHVQRLATLSVMPASDVILNQTITLECVYANGQLGAAFSYGARSCLFAYIVCSGCQLFTSLECPNNQTYRISLTVDSSWHKVTMYCEPPFGGPRSNTITLNVTIPVSGLVLNPSQLTVNRGETITLTCQTDYCNPPAMITWYKATSGVTSQSTPTEDKNQEDLVRTTSVLRFTGVIGDNGQQVYCIASNTQGRSVESNRYTIDVKYISDVKILPGSKLKVVTGQNNVWIYCYTENPEDHAEYSWTKINSNSSSIVSNGQVYVLQTATIEYGGTYTCTASNSVGNSSGSVDISVQYKPLAPVLVHVDCRSTEAYVIWTSPSTNSINDVHHSLQLSENKNVFLNASFEKMNRTNDIEINTCKVTNLKPGSVYIFRVLTSTHYGIALSNNHSCVTDPERMEDTNKGCPTEQIIGGIIGGAVLTIFSVVVAYAFCKYRKERKNEDKNKETMDSKQRTNVIISREDHHYLGISKTETTDTNVYEKIKDSNKAENRVQYLELIDVPEVDKKNDRVNTPAGMTGQQASDSNSEISRSNESGYSNIT